MLPALVRLLHWNERAIVIMLCGESSTVDDGTHTTLNATDLELGFKSDIYL
jgi:hypothetical protein